MYIIRFPAHSGDRSSCAKERKGGSCTWVWFRDDCDCQSTWAPFYTIIQFFSTRFLLLGICRSVTWLLEAFEVLCHSPTGTERAPLVSMPAMQWSCWFSWLPPVMWAFANIDDDAFCIHYVEGVSLSNILQGSFNLCLSSCIVLPFLFILCLSTESVGGCRELGREGHQTEARLSSFDISVFGRH